MTSFTLGLAAVIGLAAMGCGAQPPALLEVNETFTPVTIAVHADATYVVDESGAVVRMRDGARHTIAKIDGHMEAATGVGKVSVGEDESVWYADPRGSFHAYSGSAWSEHDLTSVVGGGDYGAAINWRVAARSIDDAWGVAYVFAGSTLRFQLCHWDGHAWTCEGMTAIAPPTLIAVSASYVWLLGADNVVRRRDKGGQWTELASDVCSHDLQVADDEHAFVGGCEKTLGVAAWNGSRFASIDDQATSFVARSATDVWLVHAADGIATVSHHDGTTVTELGAAATGSHPRLHVIPTAPGAALLHVVDRSSGDAHWYDASFPHSAK